MIRENIKLSNFWDNIKIYLQWNLSKAVKVIKRTADNCIYTKRMIFTKNDPYKGNISTKRTVLFFFCTDVRFGENTLYTKKTSLIQSNFKNKRKKKDFGQLCIYQYEILHILNKLLNNVFYAN